MKKQIMTLALGGLLLHGGGLVAMNYKLPIKKRSTSSMPWIDSQQIVKELLVMDDPTHIKELLCVHSNALLKYREPKTGNTLLHLAVYIGNKELICAILTNEKVGSPKPENFQTRLRQLEDAHDTVTMPLRWAYNDDNQTALDVAKGLGRGHIIKLFHT